jgi:hypothetical protein
MPSPFPGMDPYLEHPARWRDVHNSLIVAIRDALSPLVAPRYAVTIEARTYTLTTEDLALIGLPDVGVVQRAVREGHAGYDGGGPAVLDVTVPIAEEVEEIFLEIRDTSTHHVVTVIEVLSPTNKLARGGRTLYERKRAKIVGTRTNLVEVDLLRVGAPMPVLGPRPPDDYRILVSRGSHRPRARLYVWTLRQPIPAVPVPLQPHDPEPTLDVGGLLKALYDRARYDMVTDYGRPAVPPLGNADDAWARTLIAAWPGHDAGRDARRP